MLSFLSSCVWVLGADYGSLGMMAGFNVRYGFGIAFLYCPHSYPTIRYHQLVVFQSAPVILESPQNQYCNYMQTGPTCTPRVDADRRRELGHRLVVHALHEVALAAQVVTVRVVRVLLHSDIIGLLGRAKVVQGSFLASFGLKKKERGER